MKKLRHRIEYTRLGNLITYDLQQVLGRDLSVNGSLENDEIFYNEKLGQKLRVGRDDYPTLKEMFDSQYYEDVTYIFENCGVEVFRGVFTMLNGSFCEDECICEFEIVKNDIYNCLEKGDKDVNFFQLPCSPIVTTSELKKNIEVLFIKADFPQNGCDAQFTYPTYPSSPWYDLWQNHDYHDRTLPNPDPQGQTNCDDPSLSYSLLAREKKVTPCISGNATAPVGSGWVLLSNDCSTTGQATYVRPYTISGFNGLDFSDHNPNPYYGTNYPTSIQDVNGLTIYGFWDNYPFTISSINYTRNRSLDCVIEELVKKACPSVTCYESNFFNDATNYVTGQPNELNNLLIAEKSDMADPTSSNPATKEQINFFDLYENLRTMFDVRFFIDSNNCLKIEHISTYFNNQIDLRDKEISKFCCWEIENDNIPVREVYKFHESESIDFKGIPIEYNPIIAKGDEEEKKADLITTDIGFIQTTDKADQSLDGFVITANEENVNPVTLVSELNVKNEIGELSGNNIINGHLSWANLHENYHKDWKYLPSGELNNNQINFDSTRPIRKNKSNIYLMNPTEFLDFRANISGSSVITNCGVGVVQSYKYEVKNNILRLEVTLF